MRFFQILRNLIKMNDLFYAREMLRYDKELEYRSVTGGLLSLGIIIAVIIGFASMIINTLQLNTINFVEVVSKDSTPARSTLTMGGSSNFMLGVEIWGVDMTAKNRYFDVLMIQLNTTSGQRDYTYNVIPMQSCTKKHWQAFPDIAGQFEQLSMSNWLCPPINTSVPLSGDFTSNLYQYVNISVNPCIDWLNPNRPCANKTQIATLFEGLSDAIRFKIYYTNPLINAGSKNYKSYYLQSSNYISFGSTIGGQGFLYLADYSVVTDRSIWPYSSTDVDKGILIQDRMITHPYTTFRSTYACYYLVKSPTSYSYIRSVQKISTVFSFIGGLISAISAALFILKIYNNLAFQVSVAICIFKPKDDSLIDVKSLGMNICTFFKYYLYHFLTNLGKEPDWPNTNFIAECQQEIVKQLDVKALVKRIIFLQYCMTNLFEDYQLQGLQMQKPKTPEDIEKIREKCESLDTYQQHHFMDTEKGECQIMTEQSNVEIITTQKQRSHKFQDIMSPTNFQKNNTNDQPQTIMKGMQQKNPFSEVQEDRISPFQRNLEKKRKKTPIKEQKAFAGQQRRSINLSILRKNAEQGNPLSKKIWNQLQRKNYELNQLKPRMRKLV